MGGYLNFVIKFVDGTIDNAIVHTNYHAILMHSKEVLEKDEHYLRNYLKEYQKDEDQYPNMQKFNHELCIAPYGYGLVILDLKYNKILTYNDYSGYQVDIVCNKLDDWEEYFTYLIQKDQVYHLEAHETFSLINWIDEIGSTFTYNTPKTKVPKDSIVNDEFFKKYNGWDWFYTLDPFETIHYQKIEPLKRMLIHMGYPINEQLFNDWEYDKD